MHRTQIYLQDALYTQLKHQSQMLNVSISEIIRQAVEKDLTKSAHKNASLFFASLTPLQSFADTDATQYVDELRNSSRLLRKEPGTEAA